MKAGMQVGQTATFNCEVTSEMFAQFEGAIVHPVYSTVSMVYHMELTSRKLILPYLEEHEEGMGSAVSLKHIAPATDRNRIQVTATISKLEKNLVFTEVQTFNETRIIGKGTVVQIILPKDEITRKIENCRT
ncbi:thioesterase [Peribacillus cavernae]|uniref:Thioesterase n=1 Tax=Peribacillus cavernae TaxID=1674310 RepID=A0A3S0UG92_9BACI|nr:thioesterase [Peribacillus cavernae]MDQ0218729.1 putative thioesterase [Peribacillus cavernae]RUQ30943.1 thioesterase [Peribacillus cavernae]